MERHSSLTPISPDGLQVARDTTGRDQAVTESCGRATAEEMAASPEGLLPTTLAMNGHGALLQAIHECILLCHPVAHSEAFTDET
jgi:hypothetical protein